MKKYIVYLLIMANVFALEKATFAGGCFWCMEEPFEIIDGVIKVESGFMGGIEVNPSYNDVASGRTGHREVVQIVFDNEKISYEKLLDVFWRQIDPTDDGGQFVDRGFQYTTAIYYHNQLQFEQAKKSKELYDNLGIFSREIVTPLVEAGEFYKAEDYHQDYYKKSKLKYKYYRSRSGRDDYLEEIWEGVDLKMSKYSGYIKPTDKELKESLDKLTYKVTQKNGTERAFTGEYNDNKEKGIYVDILSGEPLFSSTHKYDSKSGWPSFYDIIDNEFIVRKDDFTLFSKRIEVRSKYGDNHLGHVFSDGPNPTGLRYCINSVAIKFVPFEKMEELGYEEYLSLFD